jgi:hypothetical protein
LFVARKGKGRGHRLRGFPLASEIVRHARQDLVRRLDGYEVEQPETFDDPAALAMLIIRTLIASRPNG